MEEVSAAVAGREDLYGLAWAVYRDPTPAMGAAAGVRDGHFGPRVTYPRKVSVPPTKLCRDNCGYCRREYSAR